MPSNAPADGPDRELVTRLGQCLRVGTILDLQGAVIPADLLRAALIGQPYSDGPEPVIGVADIDPRGLQITNADIRGQLDLSNAAISPAVTITNSTIPDGIDLGGARLNRCLSLRHSVISSLNLLGAAITGELNLGGAQLTGTQDGNSLVADRLQVDGGAFLNCGFTAAGTVRLSAARITGTLAMSGAQLTGTKDGNGLVADGLQVDGDAFLNGGFTAAGSVRLLGARITEQLNLGGARLTGPQDGNSLIADLLQVGGGAFFDGFSAIGTVRLPDARITGQISLGGAQLTGTDQDSASLVANRLQVDGDALLNDGFTAGTVHLLGARITGQLNMGGAQLTGTDQDGASLVADGLQVDSAAFLNGGFTAAGTVRLIGARITGQLNMRGAQLTGPQDGDSLVADGLQVDGDAFLNGGFTAAGAVRLLSARITGQLHISGQSVRAGMVDSPGLILTGATIDDSHIDLSRVDWINEPRVRPNPSSLPARRVVLSLENFTYKHRPDPGLGGVETWLRVLRFHTPDYEPRTYQQLAAAHRATGHDRDAARILMAQQDHRRATTLRPRPGARLRHRIGLWASRVGLGFWKAALGYGYRPRRALGWLLALLATAGLLVTIAAHWQADPETPDVPVAYRPGNPTTSTPPEYCSFGEAAGLAVRIAIPLVTNLGQGACIVNTGTIPGSIIVTASIALQTLAWILGGLTIAAAATAIKRSP